MRGVYSKAFIVRIQSFLWTINKLGRCWTSSLKTGDRYVPISINRRAIWGHRLMWFIVNGPIPAKTVICHHCDNTLCLNPVHLYSGNDRGNAMDRAKRPTVTLSEPKQRGRYGVEHWNHKLTQGKVLLIRTLFSTGRKSLTELSRIFEVKPTTVNAILKGRTWVRGLK